MKKEVFKGTDDLFIDKKKSGIVKYWNNLSLATKNTFRVTMGIISFTVLGLVGSDDAKIEALEKDSIKILMKEESDYQKKMKAEQINPLFLNNAEEAGNKFRRILKLSKKEWAGDVLITTRFINNENHSKFNGIDVFIGEIKGTLKKKGQLELLTAEIENRLKVELLKTASYEDELKKLDNN